jgi:diaminopimelate epimerase
MTTISLTKHHGLGNDFLVVFDPPVDDLAGLARRLCDRRRGIGADGLLIGSAAAGFDARMVLHNADGSRAEMSGNGIRCFAHAVLLFRNGPPTQRILTDAGDRLVTVDTTDDPHTVVATVSMGLIEQLAEPEGWSALGAHPDRPVAHVGLGNPHSVVGVDDVDAVDLATLGAQVPSVNLEIIEPGPEPNAITMRVHERGAGITEACGTGACASAWAAVSWGLVPASASEIIVHMAGGSAKVLLDQPVPGAVMLAGPATYVARIEIDLT